MATVMSIEDFATLAAGAANSGGRQQPSWQVVEMGKQLLHAARSGDTPNVLELMSKGAPFTTDWLGTSALHLAAMNNHSSTCAVLLRAGISRETRTKVDRTPLHLAAYEGHADICMLLLSNGAYVDCRDMLSMTPLHWAVERNHIGCVTVLLESGADPKAVSKFYKTPVSIAKETARWEILKLLHNSIKKNNDVPLKLKEEKPSDDEDDMISCEDPLGESKAEQDMKKFAQLNSQAVNVENSEAAQILRTHGISMQPATHPNTVLSAINYGRTILLSDAGKLLLKESGSSKMPYTKPIKITPLDTCDQNKPSVKPSIIRKVVKLSKPNYIKIEKKTAPVKKKPINTILNLSQLQALQKEGIIQLQSAGGLKSAVKIVMHKNNFGKFVAATNNAKMEAQNQLPFLLTPDKPVIKEVETKDEMEILRRELEQAKKAIKEKDKQIEELKGRADSIRPTDCGD